METNGIMKNMCEVVQSIIENKLCCGIGGDLSADKTVTRNLISGSWGDSLGRFWTHCAMVIYDAPAEFSLADRV